ncbi:unnamed protein product, partial [Fusarium graminearum]
ISGHFLSFVRRVHDEVSDDWFYESFGFILEEAQAMSDSGFMGAELDRVVHLVASKVGQESSEFLWFAAIGVWLAWLEDLS